MKQLLTSVVCALCVMASFSQDSKLSIEANYPFPVDNNFVGEDAYGIIDLGLKYRFLDLSPVNIGLSFNGGVLVNNSNQNNFPQDYQITTYIFQPKVFAELDIASLQKFHPFVGLGYTFMNLKASGSNNGMDVSGDSDTLSGFGFNVGLAYDISDSFFIQAQYDFTKLNVDDDIPNIAYNTNVNLVKVGVGFRL